MMLVGYARTSTVDQEAGLEAQLRELKERGCEKVFQEQTSSVGQRKALEDALEFTRQGDALVVTKLDRLARSVTHLGEIIARLGEKVALRILDLGIDTQRHRGAGPPRHGRYRAVRAEDDVGASARRHCESEGGGS